MKSILAAGAAAGLIIMCGLVNAYWSGSIGHAKESEILKEFSERLDHIPLLIGDWKGTDEGPLDPREKVIAGAEGSISRRYVNDRTKQTVSIFLVSGHFRSIAQHTPAQCYVAAGYQMLRSEQQYDVETDAGTVESYTTVFKREESLSTQYLRVFWTWSFDGKWMAPGMPRVALRGKPALYKLYFITETLQSVPIEQTPSVEFMRTFIPTVNAILFPQQPESPTEESPITDASAVPLAS